MDKGRLAVVVGGSGAVGKALVAELLRNSGWSVVRSLGRRNLEISQFLGNEVATQSESQKLEQTIVNFDDLSPNNAAFEGCDSCFCCLGTTLKIAGSKEAQYKVDVEYAVATAKAAKEAGVKHFSLVSSSGANANSSFFYLKIKGEVEEKVKALGFERTTIVRPNMLFTSRERTRPFEAAFQVVWKVITPVLPASQKGISVQNVAKAMRVDAEQGTAPLALWYNGDLLKMAHSTTLPPAK